MNTYCANLEIGNNGKTKWMVNCKWVDLTGKDRFLSKIHEIASLSCFGPQ